MIRCDVSGDGGGNLGQAASPPRYFDRNLLGGNTVYMLFGTGLSGPAIGAKE